MKVGQLGGYPGYSNDLELLLIPTSEIREGDKILFCVSAMGSFSRWAAPNEGGPLHVGVSRKLGGIYTAESLRYSHPSVSFYCLPRAGEPDPKKSKWNDKCRRCGGNTFVLFSSVEHEGSCKP